jgi:hypothetical protein
MRAKGARSLDELDRELPAVLAAVTPGDARGWFRLCGYPAPTDAQSALGVQRGDSILPQPDKRRMLEQHTLMLRG